MEFWIFILAIFTIVNFIQLQNLKKENKKLSEKLEFLKHKIKGEEININKQGEKIKEDQVAFENVKSVRPVKPYNRTIKQKRVRREQRESLENVFGKNIIGIIAAVLIFIGIIAFGALVFKAITDAVKVMLIFIASFAMSGIGIYLVKRDSNAFTNSILGCGFGAIFVSVFVTHLYFHIISDLIAFLLILCWMLAVYFVSKRLHSKVLLYLSHIGCIVSIFMTIPYRIDGLMLIEITLYQIVSLSMLIFMDFLEVQNETVLELNPAKFLFKFSIYGSMLFNFVWSLFIAQMHGSKNYTDVTLLVLGCLTILTNIVLYFISQRQVYKNAKLENIFSIVLHLMTILFGFGSLISRNIMEVMPDGYAELFTMFVIISTVLLSHFINKLINKIKDVNVSFITYLSILLTILLLNVCINDTYLVGIFVIVLTAIYTFLVYKYRDIRYFILNLLSITSGLFYVICIDGNVLLPVVIYSILYFLDIIYLWKLQFNEYFNFPFIYFVYINIPFLISLIKTFEPLELEYPLASIIVMILNIALYVKLNTLKDDRDCFKVSNILTYILEGIILGVFSIFIAIESSGGFLSSGNMNDFGLSILSLLMLIFGLVRLTNLIQNKNGLLGVWYGIKVTWLTVFPLATLTGFLDEQMIFSVVCMLIALACIYFGFKFEIKSTRIYGLILTIASVLKIVIADVWQQDSVIRVIALILGGAICFGISAIYNYIERNQKVHQGTIKDIEKLEDKE